MLTAKQMIVEQEEKPDHSKLVKCAEKAGVNFSPVLQDALKTVLVFSKSNFNIFLRLQYRQFYLHGVGVF